MSLFADQFSAMDVPTQTFHYYGGKMVAQIDDPLAEIASYRELENGWDFGEGVTFSDRTIENAELIYWFCIQQGFGVETHPNTNGSINLIAFVGDNFLEMDITESFDVRLRYAQGKGEEYRIIWKDACENIGNIGVFLLSTKSKWQQNTLYAHSTLRNTQLYNRGLKAIKSFNPMVAAYQFSLKDAQEIAPTRIYATT